MQRKKSTKDTRNAAYLELKRQFDLYVEFNTANQRELRDLRAENNKLKAYTKVEKVTVYDNGICEIIYKDGEDMLVNHVVYSDAYLTGWEVEDCFIKK
ncbi:hypothetical protein A0U40_09755 [[Bacillus] sp. KCTC 13219]|nr:hypothetical protein A0U40_09755 [[Bacillus] sp. KCTC 13219]